MLLLQAQSLTQIFSILLLNILVLSLLPVMANAAHNIMERLQRDILPLQGYKAHKDAGVKIGFAPIEQAFPNHAFPTGAIHDFTATAIEAIRCM